VSIVVKGIQPTIGDVLWPKNYKKLRTKKLSKGNQLKISPPKDSIFQQNEKPNSLTKNKGTYASVAASGLNHQRTQNLEYNDINQTLQLILT
jgi:hypothetical protein